jgi:hypothetical protein
MQIILGKEIADEVRTRHMVLELETFDVPEKGLTTAYCVLQSEKLVISELPDMERLLALHQAVVDAWNRGDYSTVSHGIEHIRGKFGGELDTFYDELEKRIREQQLG